VISVDHFLLDLTGCPNWQEVERGLAVIAAEQPDITVTRHLVESSAEAERTGFHGSPSSLIDGIDPFAEPGAGVGLACRVSTPKGLAGAPTLDQLRAAVLPARASRRQGPHPARA
jgi:hypothetical protein